MGNVMVSRLGICNSIGNIGISERVWVVDGMNMDSSRVCIGYWVEGSSEVELDGRCKVVTGMTLGMHGLNGRRCTAWHTGNDSVKCIDLGCNVGSNLHGATGVISVLVNAISPGRVVGSEASGHGFGARYAIGASRDMHLGINLDTHLGINLAMDKRNALVGILAGLCMIVLYVSIWVVGDGTGLWITAGYSGYLVESSIISGSIG